MANHNWGKKKENGKHTGKCMSRNEAKARLRHNDKTRRADPMVNHTNLSIDKNRTHLNYELGPTAGMTYEEKCERLDARLDALGYADDGRQCMQGIISYAPLELDDGKHPEELRRWFEDTAEVLTAYLGEENIMGMFVDLDEIHEYESVLPGEEGTVRRSRSHLHTDVVNACEYVPNAEKRPYYLTPEGELTLDESEAATEEERTPRRKRDQRGHAVRVEGPDGKLAPVYETPDGGETFVVDEAAEDVKTVPVYARYKSKKPGKKGSIKYAPPEKKPAKRYGLTSRFQTTERMRELNKMTEMMTREKFNGLHWMEKEPDDPTPERERPNYTVEELSEETVARVAAKEYEKALEQISANVDRSEALLDEAEYDRLRAQLERYGSVTFVHNGKVRSKPLPPPEDGVDLCEYAATIDEKYAGRDLTDEGLGFVLYVSHSPRVRAARAERAAQAIREDAEAKAAEAKELMQEVDKRSDEALERMGDAAAQEAALDARKAALDKQEAGLKAQRAALEKQRAEQDARAAVLDEQEREIAPLLKMVRSFIEHPVAFVADAMRRVQRYVAKVAHGDDAPFEMQLTNEGDNAAIERTLNLMYSHASDPDMCTACAPDAPALTDDERAAPIFDVDAWLEGRRRRRAAQRVAKIPRQSLQQRFTQQPEQQPAREVWLNHEPKQRGGYGPSL